MTKARKTGSRAFSLSESGRRSHPWLEALPADQQKQLLEYAQLVFRWNQALNLVGAKSFSALLDDLLADSISLADFVRRLPLPASPLTWDPGAGAGLPGIPLRIVWQAGAYVMIETREKRALFLVSVLARLGLPRTCAVRSSLQEYWKHILASPEPRLPDCVISRAFMPWQKLLSLVRPMLAKDGLVVIMARDAPVAAEGWQLAGSMAYASTGGSRWLWALAPV